MMANRLRACLSAAFGYGIKHDNNPRNLNAKTQFHLKSNPVLFVDNSLTFPFKNFGKR